MASVADAYAKALYELALDSNDFHLYLDEAKAIRQVLKDNRQFLNVLSSYFISFNEKEKVLDEVFKDFNNTKIVTFFKVVTKHKRAYLLIYILKEFIKLAETHLKVMSGKCISARKLSSSELEEVIMAFEKRLKTKVELVNVVDPSLIGGIRVELRGKIFDSSLKMQLTEMQEQILKGVK